jgi:hypothetical protein
MTRAVDAENPPWPLDIDAEVQGEVVTVTVVLANADVGI